MKKVVALAICLCNVLFASMVVPEDVECAVCGGNSENWIIQSTSMFGSRDLDWRAPDPDRGINKAYVQYCGNCGYCAYDISKRTCDDLDSLLRREIYVSQLHDADYPVYANYFLCAALMEEYCERYDRAGWYVVRASWECDDEGFKESADRCRMRAVELFEKAKENGQDFMKQDGADDVVLTDLLRKSGKFGRALSVCNDRLDKNPEDIIKKMLEFEKYLINSKNVGVYSVKDAIEYAETQ
jgi:hypothetical protein